MNGVQDLVVKAKEVQAEIDQIEKTLRLRLLIDCVPIHFCSLHQLCPRKLWSMIRKKFFSFYGQRCSTCRSERGSIHCHEVWALDYETQIQRFETFVLLCDECHKTRHFLSIGFWASSASLAVSLKRKAHFLVVNNCTSENFDLYLEKLRSLERLVSKLDWRISLPTLESLEKWAKDIHSISLVSLKWSVRSYKLEEDPKKPEIEKHAMRVRRMMGQFDMARHRLQLEIGNLARCIEGFDRAPLYSRLDSAKSLHSLILLARDMSNFMVKMSSRGEFVEKIKKPRFKEFKAAWCQRCRGFVVGYPLIMGSGEIKYYCVRCGLPKKGFCENENTVSFPSA